MTATSAYNLNAHAVNKPTHGKPTDKYTGMTGAQIEDMYRLMALANYEDRFVIPTTHREYAEDAYDLRGGCGFSFGEGCGEPKQAPQRTGLFKKATAKEDV